MCAYARGRARGDGACVPHDSRRGPCAERASRPSCIGACGSMQAAWQAAAGGCSIDFARAPASRGGCWPAIARGSALRDGEEARPRPGAPPMHRRSAPLQAAVVRQFTPCNARARGVLRASARPRGSAQEACQAARPSEPSGGLQAARSRRSTSDTATPKRRRAAGGARRARAAERRGRRRSVRQRTVK